MTKLEYLKVQKLNSKNSFRLIVILEESKNDYYSRYVVELIPLTHTKVVSDDLFSSKINLFPPRFSFELELNHTNKTATFAAHRDVIVPKEMRGCGLGSYAFSRLIEWGQNLHPTYRVVKLKLAEVDAQTDEARDQRNDFYGKHKFEFDFSLDPEKRTGWCFAESLAHLRPGINTDKVNLFDLPDEMSELIMSNEKLTRENAERNKALNTCIIRNQELSNNNSHPWLLIILFVILALIFIYWRIA